MHLVASENCLQWNNSAVAPPGRPTTVVTSNFDGFWSYLARRHVVVVVVLGTRGGSGSSKTDSKMETLKIGG